jgi:protein-disulfide isomerase
MGVTDWARLLLATFLVLALSLGCGGGSPAPEAPPAAVMTVAVPVAAAASPASEGAAAVASASEPDPGTAIPVTRADPQRGSALAPVTMVVWGDFQCPFTARLMKTLGELTLRYGEGSLRVVWKDYPLPFHKQARPAAIAAETVFRLGGDRAFWAFARQAFAEQSDLEDESFVRWAVASGIPEREFRIAYEGLAHEAAVDADTTLGKSVGVTGTPASFTNGVFLSGAQPIERFVAVIDQQISVAQREGREGLAPHQVYAVLSDRHHAEALRRAKSSSPSTAPAADEQTEWLVPITGSPAKGGKKPLVTLVMFADFQCPFSARVVGTIAELETRYGEALRIVWKNNPLPFHVRAEPAAELALEARAQKGDKAFWAAYDKLFANQAKLDDADLLAYARELKLDVGRVKAAIEQKKHGKAIAADIELTKTLGAVGTPTFYIDGRKLVGAQPIEKFAAIIDEEIARAEKLLASGTPRAALYDVMQKGAKAGPSAQVNPAPAPAPQVAAPGMFGAKHLVIMYAGSARQASGVTRTKAEALALATKVAARARRGDKFEDLVSTYSDEPGAAARGGDLGTFPGNAMVPEFQAAVEALRVGEVSGVVETKFGYHVIVRTQ